MVSSVSRSKFFLGLSSFDSFLNLGTQTHLHQFVLFDCSTSIVIDARPNVASKYLLPERYSVVKDGLGQM